MRMDKLTTKFQQALAEAQSLALGKDHQFIEPIHLMLALLDQEDGSIKPLLVQNSVQTNDLRDTISQEINRLASVSGSGGDVQISSELSRMLNLTDKYAQQRQDNFISSELFLLAAIETKGSLQTLLKKFGINNIEMEGCNIPSSTTAKHIAFDYLGRAHRGVGGYNDTSKQFSKIMISDCNITFTMSTDVNNDGDVDIDDNFIITICQETGYSFLYKDKNTTCSKR